MPFILTKDPHRLSLMSLTGITESSLELIHCYQDLLQPLVDPIVEELYEEIYKIDQLQKIIDGHSTLEKLKKTQKVYLEQAFSPIIDDLYIQNRYKIGNVHSRIGLNLHWYISVHRRYCQIIADLLMKLLPVEEATRLCFAIQSVLNFDVQITVDAYNTVEMDKAVFPLRYEFKELQIKSGLTEKDLDILDAFNGRLTFRLEEILSKFKRSLLIRIAGLRWSSEDIEQLICYLKPFLSQFFQEKIYKDEAAFYRIIRDWVQHMVQQAFSIQALTSLIDILNEVLRETFIQKAKELEEDLILFVASFERLTRLALSIMRELLTPYKSLHISRFLNIYSYEIETIDFGKLTWTDENAIQLLASRGIRNTEIIGKRCFEVFYKRVLPCTGCPIRNQSDEAFLTSFENGAKSSYYKTWKVPQSKIAEISHRLLVSQDITDESKVTFNTIESLLQLAELRDDDTGKHVIRIGLLAAALAQLAGCDKQFIQHIQLAAQFHDVGKVGIPDSILNKPGKLTSEEFEFMKTHAEVGHQILAKLELPVIQMASQIAKTHHEKWNGTGYPNQLKGEEIPLEGRIVAIVDVFDALLSKRAYKDPLPPAKVKDILKEGKNEHFDPALIDLFLSMWGEFLEIYEQINESDTI